REQCCGKTTKFKKIDESIHKPLYDRMHKKLTENKSYHRRLVKRRSSTVEPVLGTLINHHNMKRINSRGMSQANKHVLMPALCYNLKKYLKFTYKITSSIALKMSLGGKHILSSIIYFLNFYQLKISPLKFCIKTHRFNTNLA